MMHGQKNIKLLTDVAFVAWHFKEWFWRGTV